MRAIDTNALVRLIARDDAAQVARAEKAIEKGAWVSLLVLVETVWVLDAVYARTPKQIALAVEMLLNHAQLSIQDAQLAARALEHFRAYPKLGFSDCLILEIARQSGHIPLATFDRKLGDLDGAERI
ncbi:type II toxin-antitoxin system VapC family toxin [Vitreimonas sp.]|uniref:PIN domain-containing protein n=1 Tax=Vitreimonas sp. TaxID=3069702 RepID=UPI002EDA5DD4